jgi:hypothetical protein
MKIDFKKIWATSLFQQMLSYFIFYALIWIVHLLFVSVLSFFHFLLNHQLGTIEAWIFAWGWPIILICKLASLGVIWKFLIIKMDRPYTWKDVIKFEGLLPSGEIIVISIFLLLAAVWVCRPSEAGDNIFQLSAALQGVVGISFFYFSDVFMIKILDDIYPLQEKHLFWRKIVFPLAPYASFYAIFHYSIGPAFFLYWNTLLMIYLCSWRGGRWPDILFTLFIYISPAALFLGQDPVWGEYFQIFKMARPMNALEYSILVLIAIGYLWRRQGRRENIRFA